MYNRRGCTSEKLLYKADRENDAGFISTLFTFLRKFTSLANIVVSFTVRAETLAAASAVVCCCIGGSCFLLNTTERKHFGPYRRQLLRLCKHGKSFSPHFNSWTLPYRMCNLSFFSSIWSLAKQLELEVDNLNFLVFCAFLVVDFKIISPYFVHSFVDKETFESSFESNVRVRCALIVRLSLADLRQRVKALSI